jgi:hypothetical protein
MFHAAATAAVLAWLGPLWGLVCFLSVAVVRLALRVQALVYDNAELKRRLPPDQQPFVFDSLLELQDDLGADGDGEESPPASEVRPSRALRALGVPAGAESRSKRA